MGCRTAALGGYGGAAAACGRETSSSAVIKGWGMGQKRLGRIVGESAAMALVADALGIGASRLDDTGWSETLRTAVLNFVVLTVVWTALQLWRRRKAAK